MIQILLPLFLALLAVFSGSYMLYFAYVRNHAKKSWKLEIDYTFQPEVSILIPVHNEENSIQSKLENIKMISYPKERIEVIVADDASTDKTLEILHNFVKNNPNLNIKVVGQKPRAGKSAALNKATTCCAHQIVIVSDADTHWPLDIFQKALPYLADPQVGAVTGRGINRNVNQSWVTKGEETYLNFVNLLRLGESKIHSTIRFEGGFCAFRKNAFDTFDCVSGSDDSGTALEVVQNGHLAILAPEAIFYTEFPSHLTEKLKIKVRRANQLISLHAKCLRLMLKKQLRIPRRLAIPEILLFLINPFVFFYLIVASILIVALDPLSLFSLVLLLSVAGLLLFTRRIFLEIFFDNLILFYALVTFIFGKRYVTWEKT